MCVCVSVHARMLENTKTLFVYIYCNIHFFLKKSYSHPEVHLFMDLSSHNVILRLQISNLELSTLFFLVDFSSSIFIFISLLWPTDIEI